MKTKTKRQLHTPRRAERVQRVEHTHVLTLPKNGRAGCALCPYVAPRTYKLTIPEHMKADKNAKGHPHPNNHSVQSTTTENTSRTIQGVALSTPAQNSSTKVEPSTTDTAVTDAAEADAVGTDLWSLTVSDLYARATTKKVRGRSTMSKGALIKALS